jgi:hypothetical protein
VNNFEYKLQRTTAPIGPRVKRPPLSLFRRPADARTREIARAAAIEILG